MVPEVGTIDGTYLWTLSLEVDPHKPMLFRAELQTATLDGDLVLSIAATPLVSVDRTTEVGTTVELGPYDILPTGELQATFALEVPGEANPITGTILDANIEMRALVCADQALVCGTVTGEITLPAHIPLAGSTFTFDRATGVGQYAEPPVINCQGETAVPLG